MKNLGAFFKKLNRAYCQISIPSLIYSTLIHDNSDHLRTFVTVGAPDPV